jgi:HK97 family phage major capsid protein
VSLAELEPLTATLHQQGEMPAPGSWQAALYRDDAPGAALDSQPWAHNWGLFIRAVCSRTDSTARQYIANVMTSRPRNAFGERVPAEGGFLVPEYLRSQVLAYMTRALIRPRAMVLPMTTLRLPVPTLDNSSQAASAQALGGLTFAFTEESAAIATSNPNFGRTVLEARKLAAYLANVPNELVDDAAPAFGDFLASVIGRGLAWVEDDYFIGTNGTGAGCPQGIVNAPCAVTVTRATSSIVSLADVAKMVNALHPASLQAGMTPGITDVCWLVSASAFTSLMEMYLLIGTTPTSAAAAGIPWISLGDGKDTGPSMLGLPMVVTDHQPAVGTAGDVMLADLQHYLIGDRLEMVIERSEQSNFIDDVSNFRIRSRVDGRYWIQSAETTEASQSVSPVVVLH